jgi:HD-like signal output (HDOD) protein
MPVFEPVVPAYPTDLDAWVEWFASASLPVLPQTADLLEVMRANEDAVDANLLGETIAADPLMTLKVLAYAGQHRPERVITDPETVTAVLVLMGIGPFFRSFGPQVSVDEVLEPHPRALAALQALLQRAARAARFALDFAVHRMDNDAPVLYEAALLTGFADLLLWCHAPHKALQLDELRDAYPSLRPEEAEQAVLGTDLHALELALKARWKLPHWLRLDPEEAPQDPQWRTVDLAVRVARRLDVGWDQVVLEEEIQGLSTLLNLAPASVLHLLREVDA